MTVEFKKLAGVDAVETATDAANVLIEEGGTIKRVPKTEVGGAGVSSWNDLTDKPFYEVEKEYKYDGVLEGKDTFVQGGTTFIKVSDDLPSIDSLKNGAIYYNGEKQYDVKYYSNNDTAFWDTMSACLIICYSTNITIGSSSISVPSTGVYLNDSGNYLKLTELKTIDEKFIPNVANGSGGGASSIQGTVIVSNTDKSKTLDDMFTYTVLEKLFNASIIRTRVEIDGMEYVQILNVDGLNPAGQDTWSGRLPIYRSILSSSEASITTYQLYFSIDFYSTTSRYELSMVNIKSSGTTVTSTPNPTNGSGKDMVTLLELEILETISNQ